MRQGTVVTVKPEVRALTVAEAKRHLRFEQSFTAEDEHVARLCRAAEQHVENMLGFPIMAQTRETHLASFPCGGIWLSAGPDLNVVSVHYINTAGVETLLAATDYKVDKVSRPAAIYAAPLKTWPSVQCQPGAVRITWQSGWEKEDDVPADLVHAMKLLVGHWDQNREAVVAGSISKEIELAVKDLLTPHKIPFIA